MDGVLIVAILIPILVLVFHWGIGAYPFKISFELPACMQREQFEMGVLSINENGYRPIEK